VTGFTIEFNFDTGLEKITEIEDITPPVEILEEISAPVEVIENPRNNEKNKWYCDVCNKFLYKNKKRHNNSKTHLNLLDG
jgi:hypothetical protein